MKTKRLYVKSGVWEKLQLTLLYFFIALFLSFRAKSVVGRFTGTGKSLAPLSYLGRSIPSIKSVPKPENLLVIYASLLRTITSAAAQNRNISYLVKFNFVLVLLLEMLQFLLLDFWDIIFKKVSFVHNTQLKKTNIVAYSLVFNLFAILYTYCYMIALFGKIPAFPGLLNVIPRSAQYWIKSKAI